MPVAHRNNVETHNLQTEQDTSALAARIAPLLEAGDIVFLAGDLGAGKTVFARALIRKLTGDNNLAVPSPTFTLVQTYDAPPATIWHFDLYRLEEPEEVYELGWEDALYDGITLVEWPQRLGALAPGDYIGIGLEIPPNDPGQRQIHINWNKRLAGTTL